MSAVALLLLNAVLVLYSLLTVGLCFSLEAVLCNSSSIRSSNAPVVCGVSAYSFVKHLSLNHVTTPTFHLMWSASDGNVDEDGHVLANMHKDWSWLVDLMVSHQPVRVRHHHSCGGSLINERWIVTASHCFDRSRDPEHYRVRVSDSAFMPLYLRLADASRRHFSVNMDVQRVFTHPNYDHDKVTGDIALIQLKSSVLSLPGNHPFSFLQLPLDNTSFPIGLVCNTIGWRCSLGSSSSLCMAYVVPMKILPIRSCDMYALEQWINKNLCLKTPEDVHGVCEGDSGSPLVCKSADGTNMLAGLLSFVHDERPFKFPSGYTGVQQYRKWILDTVEMFSH